MAPNEIKDAVLQYLFDSGIFRKDQCVEIYDEHIRTGKSVRNVLLEMEAMTEEAYLSAVAEQLGTVVCGMPLDYNAELAKAIPVGLARMYNVVPFHLDGMSLQLAVADMPTSAAMDELTFALSKDVSYVVVPLEEIEATVEKYYGDDSGSLDDMFGSLEDELKESGDLPANFDSPETIDPSQLENVAASAPVIRFVNLVLYQAVKDKASDIHFEPFENEFKIRYRIDGALYEMAPPPRHLAVPVISRVKVISGLNIAEHRIPQDGRIQLNIANKLIDFRVSTLPTQFGESVVLRILDKSNVSLDLDNVGMPEDVYDDFVEDISKPNGIVIVTGPTGSGKTTTLYSALESINTIENKLLTAEDPVEYDVDGIMQVPVNEAIGVTFASVLRAFLRQDPDIIMVGEIRDLETAQIAIQASLTGHLVFSTLHTNDASGAITRLIDMGTEPFLISSSVESVLAQRLVRTICPTCRTAYKPDAQILDRLELSASDVGDRDFYYGEGCEECNQTGYRGRRGVFEYLRNSDPISQLINEKSSTIVIRDRAKELGMRTLREDGVRCILDGYSTVDEVMKYT